MDPSIPELMRRYQDEEQAWIDPESMAWPSGPPCPHSGVIDRAYFPKPKDGPLKTRAGHISYRRIWNCKDRLKKFSVTRKSDAS